MALVDAETIVIYSPVQQMEKYHCLRLGERCVVQAHYYRRWIIPVEIGEYRQK